MNIIEFNMVTMVMHNMAPYGNRINNGGISSQVQHDVKWQVCVCITTSVEECNKHPEWKGSSDNSVSQYRYSNRKFEILTIRSKINTKVLHD